MNYSSAVLVSKWDQAREAEPKDYVISTDPKRNLKRATYDRLAASTDDTLPQTTYQDHCNQSHLKPDFTEKVVGEPMVSVDTFWHADLDRDTGHPTRGYGSVLPRHKQGYDKFHLETTYAASFPQPAESAAPVTAEPVKAEPDHTEARKKCHSQFTDRADYRRPGRNTWQDESGIYANSTQKLALVKPTNILPTWLQ